MMKLKYISKQVRKFREAQFKQIVTMCHDFNSQTGKSLETAQTVHSQCPWPKISWKAVLQSWATAVKHRSPK